MIMKMNSELKLLHDSFIQAKNPEDIFGLIKRASTLKDELSECKKVFLKLVIKAHPDHFIEQDDKILANETFKLLNSFWEQAQYKIKNGTYGDVTKQASQKDDLHIVSLKHDYTIIKHVSTGSISDLYWGTYTESNRLIDVLLKIPRNPVNNSFMSNEASILQYLREDAGNEELINLIPECIDTFKLSGVKDKTIKHTNVFHYYPELVSLADVISSYHNGIDAKDMAWMFKRILASLWYAHSKNIIHGAVLPPHVLLNLENHGILLLDWTLSIKDNASHLKAIDPNFIDYYPKTVSERKIPDFSLDIHMTASTMIALLGGDVKSKQIPDSVPKPIKLILKACLNGMDDAMIVHKEFNKVIRELFGQPKFRDFKIPNRK
jgi:hypothetical protein